MQLHKAQRMNPPCDKPNMTVQSTPGTSSQSTPGTSSQSDPPPSTSATYASTDVRRKADVHTANTPESGTLAPTQPANTVATVRDNQQADRDAPTYRVNRSQDQTQTVSSENTTRGNGTGKGPGRGKRSSLLPTPCGNIPNRGNPNPRSTSSSLGGRGRGGNHLRNENYNSESYPQCWECYTWDITAQGPTGRGARCLNLNSLQDWHCIRCGAPRPQYGDQSHDHHYGGDRGRGRGRGRGGGRGRDNRGSRSSSRPTRGQYRPRGRRKLGFKRLCLKKKSK